MNELFNSYKRFDTFIKMQLLVIFVISLSWALILPIITKLQGTLWATSIISAFLILHKLSTFAMPWFKNFTVKETYKLLVILDGLYLVSIPIYFLSPLAFFVYRSFFDGCIWVVFECIWHQL